METISSEKFLFAVIFLIAVFLSFWCFQTNPASWFDEGIYFQVVKNIAASGTWGIQTAPGVFEDLSLISVGYPVFLPAALAFKIFGANIVILRLVAISFLLGLVLVFYFLSRKLYSPKLAFFSSLLLVTFSPLYGNGKNFLGEVPGLFYFFAGLLLLNLFERNGRKSAIFSSGILLGLAAATKPIFLLILPALAVAFLFRWPEFLAKREGRMFMLVFGLGIALALWGWFWTQFGPEVSLERIWAHYSNPYYVADYTPLVLSNLKRFFTETTPLHFLILFLLALWFLGKKIFRKEELRLVEIAAFMFSLLVGLAYLRTTGWYRNFFPGHVVLFLFFALGMESLLESVSLKKLFGAAVFLALTVQLIPLWQENLWCRPDAPTILEPYLKSIPEEKSVFFLTIPHLAARFSGDNFYQYLKMSERLKLGEKNLGRMQKGGFDYIFVPPKGAEEEISKIPACYELSENIAKVLIYKRNPALSCV